MVELTETAAQLNALNKIMAVLFGEYIHDIHTFEVDMNLLIRKTPSFPALFARKPLNLLYCSNNLGF